MGLESGLLQRSHEPGLVLRRVYVSGPITALAAALVEARQTFLGGARQARKVRKDVMGP